MKSAIRLKTKQDIVILQQGGRILAKVMRVLIKAVKPGVSAKVLDDLAYTLIKKYGGKPSFLNYQADFSRQPFPNTLCVSVNDVIVHGVPGKNLILKSGDLVSLDLGMEYQGLFTDTAVTIGLGKIKTEEKKLIEATKSALAAAINVSRPDKTLRDIGYAIESRIKNSGFAVIRDLVGHGVGYAVHEEPPVFNYEEKDKNIKLEPGLVLAIEPMSTFFNGAIKENNDGSFATLDGQKACHFEHSIAILENKTIILTK